MPGVTATIDIAAPPEKIWELMCDPHRYPEIADPTERMIDVPDTEMGVGYVYKEYGGIKPFMGESEWRVTEFEPPTHTVHVGNDGQMEFHLAIDIAPTAEGSRLRQHLEMKPSWWLALPNAVLWPLMMRRRAQEAMDKTVANVKRISEGG